MQNPASNEDLLGNLMDNILFDTKAGYQEQHSF